MKNTKSNRNRLFKSIGGLVSKLKASRIECDDFTHRVLQILDKLDMNNAYIVLNVAIVRRTDKRLSNKEAKKFLKWLVEKELNLKK